MLANTNKVKFSVLVLAAIASIAIIIFIFVPFVNKNSGSNLKGSASDSEAKDHPRCTDSNSPTVLFNLKTKLGVNYDGGHWFHMSENFLVQHSILREKGMLQSAERIIFNFDNADFVDDLNGITKLVVLLGTVNNSKRTVKEVIFAHIPNLIGLDAQSHWLEVKPSMITKFRAYDLTSKLPLADRLKEEIKSLDVFEQGSHCVKFISSIGGIWPTPQRGHWFPNKDDVKSVRSQMFHMCNIDSVDHSNQGNIRKVVVYQRDQSRKIADIEEAIAGLQRVFQKNRYEIQLMIHNSAISPCELVNTFSKVDILITSHGFQSMLLLMMPMNSVVFEIFPYKYYKRAYGPLGKEYGIFHGGVMSPATDTLSQYLLHTVSTETCMSSKYCRNYARDHDVKLTERGIDALGQVVFSRDQTMELLNKDSTRNCSSICESESKMCKEINFKSASSHYNPLSCHNSCQLARYIKHSL